MTYATPEDAARGEIPARYVRVVGVVIRGEQAVVAQVMNDVPTHEIETAHCYFDGEGWDEAFSGNGNVGFMPTGDGLLTVVAWDLAPPDAVAARFECDGQQQTVDVVNEYALAVFDDVHGSVESIRTFPRTRLSWIDNDGVETPWWGP